MACVLTPMDVNPPPNTQDNKRGRPRLQLECVLHRILFVLREGSSWRGIDSEGAAWNSFYQYGGVGVARGSGRNYCDFWIQVTSSFIRMARIPQADSNTGHGQDKWRAEHKIHVSVDSKGQPAAIALGPGQEADVSRAEEIVTLMDNNFNTLVGDKRCDSDPLRAWLKERDIDYCIPPRGQIA